jgi:CubicO group peptidase (beta-lactamase class C family)
MTTIENVLSSQIALHKTPGLQYYYFDQDSVLYSYSGGMADMANQKKVTEQTTFHAYSVTKTFTALSILQLVEKGLIELDNSASMYLPDFPYSNNITVRHLLTHTAGLANPMPLSWVHTPKEHGSFDYKKFFKTIFKDHSKTKKDPNVRFAYSNLGYVLLGNLIENVSGQSYENYVTENIIKKAGIESDQLAFTIPDADLHAKGYQKRLSFTNLLLGILLNKSKYFDSAEGKWLPSKLLYVNGISYGGLIGTGSGFVSYLQELLRTDNRLISDEKKNQLFTENKTINGKDSGMCLSWFKGDLLGKTYFAHTGGGFYYCEIRLYPELGTGSVIMFNRSGMKDARFLDKIDKHIIGAAK